MLDTATGNDVLSTEQLRAKVGVRQDKPLIRWLNENRVSWMKDAAGRPITTIAAIERVLFAESSEEVDF